MKNYHIIIILLWILWTSLWYSVQAADEDLGDCALLDNNTTLANFIDSSFVIDTIYPKANRAIAVQNLKKYCCSQFDEEGQARWWNCQKEKNSDPFAYSNYLYDHLVDVWFRALDGNTSLAYPGQVMDPLGTQRYHKLHGDNTNPWYANNPLGAIPLQVRKEFWLLWWISERWSVSYNLNEFISPNDNKAQYKEYISKRSTLPNEGDSAENSIGLASRYFIICHLSQQITLNSSKERNWFSACKKLAKKRINDENAFVQYLLTAQGVTALMSNFNAYTQWYLVQGEMNRLLEKITEMNAGLTHINNKVSEMTKMCSA